MFATGSWVRADSEQPLEGSAYTHVFAELEVTIHRSCMMQKHCPVLACYKEISAD